MKPLAFKTPFAQKLPELNNGDLYRSEIIRGELVTWTCAAMQNRLCCTLKKKKKSISNDIGSSFNVNTVCALTIQNKTISRNIVTFDVWRTLLCVAFQKSGCFWSRYLFF